MPGFAEGAHQQAKESVVDRIRKQLQLQPQQAYTLNAARTIVDGLGHARARKKKGAVGEAGVGNAINVQLRMWEIDF